VSLEKPSHISSFIYIYIYIYIYRERERERERGALHIDVLSALFLKRGFLNYDSVCH
jgi:hypothetical protein